MDTNLDQETLKDVGEEKVSNSNPAGSTSRKGTAPSQTRRDFGMRNDLNRDDNDKDAPVARLLKHLSQQNPSRRTLTAVTFSENSPVAVVGDNKGILTVYRVNEPVIISDISNPAAQTTKLKEAVWRQADPADVVKLQSTPGGTKVDGGNNNEKSAVPNGVH